MIDENAKITKIKRDWIAKYALIMIVLLDADLVITMITTSKRLDLV